MGKARRCHGNWELSAIRLFHSPPHPTRSSFSMSPSPCPAHSLLRLHPFSPSCPLPWPRPQPNQSEPDRAQTNRTRVKQIGLNQTGLIRTGLIWTGLNCAAKKAVKQTGCVRNKMAQKQQLEEKLAVCGPTLHTHTAPPCLLSFLISWTHPPVSRLNPAHLQQMLANALLALQLM